MVEGAGVVPFVLWLVMAWLVRLLMLLLSSCVVAVVVVGGGWAGDPLRDDGSMILCQGRGSISGAVSRLCVPCPGPGWLGGEVRRAGSCDTARGLESVAQSERRASRLAACVGGDTVMGERARRVKRTRG